LREVLMNSEITFDESAGVSGGDSEEKYVFFGQKVVVIAPCNEIACLLQE